MRTLVIALAVALACVPAAGAAKPDRVALPDEDPFLLPACDFPLELSPAGTQTETTYGDGRIVRHSHLEPTLTNLSTGEAQEERLRYRYVERFDEEAGVLRAKLSGRFLFLVFEGDVTPWGVAVENVLLRVVGTLRGTFDPGSGVATSMTIDGTIDDVCAELG